MPDQPDYLLDLTGTAAAPDGARRAGEGPDEEASVTGERRWIGIRFECCGVYTRVYRNPEATAYVGRCPRCGAQVRIAIGPEGTVHRLFRAR